MRRSPGTCRVHTGRQNSYLLSLIRGVQPHDTTFLKQTTVLKMLLVETNQMVWVEQSLLLLRQAFQFSVLSFLPAFFPIFSYCICILTVSGCMLPHGLISTSLTLFFPVCLILVCGLGRYTCLLLNTVAVHFLRAKTNFQLPARVSFLVFLFHSMEPFISIKVISPKLSLVPSTVNPFTVPLPSSCFSVSILTATLLICI